jgi:putative cell wall-binding protein
LTLPGSLPESTKDALAFVAPTEITVVGNTTWVSDKVFAEFNNAKRVTGTDIYESSVNVAKHFGADAGKVFLATGKDFPDALSGSALAAKYNSPILFVNDPLPNRVEQYLTDNKDKTDTIIYLLGGEGAISNNIRDSVEEIFE